MFASLGAIKREFCESGILDLDWKNVDKVTEKEITLLTSLGFSPVQVVFPWAFDCESPIELLKSQTTASFALRRIDAIDSKTNDYLSRTKKTILEMIENFMGKYESFDPTWASRKLESYLGGKIGWKLLTP
eukprot:TRINITY_DN1552_c0_g1_i8.p1 TRINITY_DN1552_c0_g1~~TRINITY_DN1552_c0_g1_i8.p1  ORF type:complete len:131 (+),score=21.51 TRINITY_DN1552_c0_g1_i8:427-819(+)